MLKFGTSTANNMANTFAAVWSSGYLEIYSGTVPTDGDVVPSVAPLLSIPLPVQAFSVASNGTISLQGTWFSSALNTGVATWFRIRDQNGNNPLIGDVGFIGTTASLTLSTLNILTGSSIQITSFSITIPLGG